MVMAAVASITVVTMIDYVIKTDGQWDRDRQ